MYHDNKTAKNICLGLQTQSGKGAFSLVPEVDQWPQHILGQLTVSAGHTVSIDLTMKLKLKFPEFNIVRDV